MTRVILITITTLTIAAGAIVAPTMSSAAGSGDCTNSYTDDGHNGPWRTTNNGGTWHGNTVQVSCPSSTTFWSGRYCIQGISAGQWVNEVCSPVSGSGGTLKISASGIVLRGPEATLVATGNARRTLIEIKGSASDRTVGVAPARLEKNGMCRLRLAGVLTAPRGVLMKTARSFSCL